MPGFLLRLALLALLAGLCGCGFGMRYVFSTSRDTLSTPDRRGLAYEEVRFPAAGGVQLHGWLVPGEAGKPLVVFFHGNAANISHRVGQIACLNGLGLSVFIFDYRGFGASTGRALSEEDLYRDGRGALAFLAARGWPPRRLIYFGSSMGAAVALQMALEVPPAGVVLECPFTSLREVAWHMTPVTYALVGWWSIGPAFDNLDKIGSLTRPLLILHGDRDDKVPLEMSKRLFARAAGPKTLQVASGAGHSDLFRVGGEAYRHAWRSFLAQGPAPPAVLESSLPRP
jgi:hypothetical protein